MPTYIFTSFTKEHRRLSDELWRRARPLADRINNATAIEDLALFNSDQIGGLIDELGIEAPRLGQMRQANDREGATRWNEDHTAASWTRRFYVAVGLLGTPDLTEYWPDVGGADLVPPDAAVVEEIGGMDALASASESDVARWSAAQELWQLGADDLRSDGVPAKFSLYTFVDLTADEEAQVAAGTIDVAQIVRERRDAIAPILAAIEGQVNSFLNEELPERLVLAATEKRTRLSNRQAVRDSLAFPEGWLGNEPELEGSAEDEESDVGGATESTVEAATDSDRALDPVEVALNPRSRLSSATFDDVLYSLRHWANAVERYPKAFGVLVEDRISDLLAATWNATLPGAGREVYTRAGKSDIFIQADAIDPGRGPATVFICEVKKARGHNVIRKALDPQLFGYLNVHDTSAVLLVLMNQKDFHGACATYLEVLESVVGHRSTTDSVAGWPLLTFDRDGRTVTVCAAFVDLHI